jgi:hypothetical protein
MGKVTRCDWPVVEDLIEGRVVEIGIRFVTPPSGVGQLQLFKRARDGFYILSRVFSHKGSFSVDEVEVLLADAMEHARVHLEMTSGVQLVLPT